MGKTLKHQISYPDGGGVPNGPVAMQALAESSDVAISRISEAPFIVCEKRADQNYAVPVNTFVAVLWDTEVFKQGITHDPAKGADAFVIQQDGMYTVNAKVAWNNPEVTAAVVINVNGVDRPTSRVDVNGGFGAWAKPTTIFDLKLKAGDVLRVRTNSTKTNIGLSSSECFFSLRKSAGYAA